MALRGAGDPRNAAAIGRRALGADPRL